MGSYTKISLRKSLATRVLLVVLGLYLIIAAAVSFSHAWFEYRYQQASITRDLEDIERAFEDGLAFSLWELDEEALKATIEGMLHIPTLVGVDVRNTANASVAVGGIIQHGGKPRKVELHVSLHGCDPATMTAADGPAYTLRVFCRKFPVSYTHGGEDVRLGEATVYSSSTVIYRRMKMQLLNHLGEVLLTLLTFTLALFWALNRYLRRPLGILAGATDRITLSNLDAFSVDTRTKGRNEIAVLEEAMRTMVANLRTAVSKREASERSLRESESKFRNLVESSSDWIWEVDMDCVYTYASPQVRNILGYSPSEIVGKTPFDLMPPEEAERVSVMAQELIGGYRPLVAIENVNIHKNGERVTLETSGVPFFDKDGKAVGYRGIDRNITNRKQAEAREDGLRDRLAAAERMESLGVLAGGVAHDLNNILGPIVAYPDLIEEDVESLTVERNETTESIRESLDTLKTSARRAAAVVRDLMALGQAGRYELTPVDLAALPCLRAQCAELMVLRNVHPKVSITGSVQPGELVVMGDEDHLARVIHNIVSNAAEATEGGGKVVLSTYPKTVMEEESQTVPPGDYAVIEVTDNGVGIAPQHVGRIFEPFFTLKQKGERSGSGLGLSVVHGIVRDHDGYIDVASEAERGTTFSLYLPRVNIPVPREEAQEQEIPGGSERVLVVDDEPFHRKIVMTSLGRCGYQVASAADGREAVKLFDTGDGDDDGPPFDLVILDMIMQDDYDGLDTYEDILRRAPNMPVIIASGHAETDRVRAAMALGAEWLAKPYELITLSCTVRRILDKARA